MSILTQDCLRDLLIYDSGRFFWRVAPSNRVFPGDQAGSLGFNGYWYIGIDGNSYLVHRLVWLWHHGSWPIRCIDHIDRDKWNNNIENLREVSMSQNLANSRVSCVNSSGFKGVSWNKRLSRWHAYIMVRRRRIHLGFFDSIEDAATAYASAANQHFGEYANTGDTNVEHVTR